MPLILRSTKGSPLTFNELDGNFTYLSESIATGGGTPATASYAETATSASYASNADVATSSTSASYALSASYAPAANSFPYVGTAEFTGSILVSGSIIPNVDGVSSTSSFSLGSPTAAWKDIYVSNGTINFIDGAGNVQGTVGAGTNGTIITGSLTVIPVNPLTDFVNNGGGTLLHKSYTSADCAFRLASTVSPYNANPQLYRTGVGGPLILPWDKKITSYSVINNLRSTSDAEPVLCLPPVYNSGYSVGETISVYNLGTAISAYKATGSMYVVGFTYGITQVDTSNKIVTGTFNTAHILSGSYGNYSYISSAIPATTESIQINPGQKATFEVVFWGTFTAQSLPNANGFPINGYSTNFTNVNSSPVYTTYLFKGIENL
jgi:hypothetical protein